MAKAGVRRPRRWLAPTLAIISLVLAAGVYAFWGDLVSTTLDPKIPFQTYRPPAAPDYARSDSWYLRPAATSDLPADVFFIAPTTYDGGADWNAPINARKANRQFEQVMAPNYVGPFVSVGRVFAPRYRQASLYSLTTLREDAREARQFAYGDIRSAFLNYMARDNGGRPFIIVGVEQGGTLALRLLSEVVARDPVMKSRLVAAYLEDTVAPADTPPIAPCVERTQTGCLAAWALVYEGDFDAAQRLLDRALVWNAQGELVNLTPRPALCFNPLLGSVTDQPASARSHLGAANATGLEWGARPAFMARKISAQCRGGVLHVSRPKSSSLKQQGTWADQRKAPGFNLFYADLEADSKQRLAAWLSR
jgi:hypothetical protein